MKTITIYTDGSCEDNPGRGGWAAILKYNDKEQIISGGESITTNNRMELTAALRALQTLQTPYHVKLHTDSEYLKNAFTNNWIRKWQTNGWMTSRRIPVKNQDLWKELWKQNQIHDVQWIKVKAHANNILNNRVDRLAVEARNRIPRREP